MLLESQILELMRPYIKTKDLCELRNVRITSIDNKALKLLLLPKRLYREYFLEIYTPEKQVFKISFTEKRRFKMYLPSIMFYIRNSKKAY